VCISIGWSVVIAKDISICYNGEATEVDYICCLPVEPDCLIQLEKA